MDMQQIWASYLSQQRRACQQLCSSEIQLPVMWPEDKRIIMAVNADETRMFLCLWLYEMNLTYSLSVWLMWEKVQIIL